jgi:hypothetical protein
MSKKGPSVPRYFFTISWLNGIKEDPHGIYLVNAAAALSYAQRRIRELQNEGRYDHPGLTTIVKDEFRQTILSLPFPPGGA